LMIFRYGSFVAIAGALLGLVALGYSFIHFTARRVLLSGTVVFVCAAIFAVAYTFKERAQRVPPIHDITTDTENPPAFVRIAELRKDTATNPIEYGGPEVARQQHEAYPNVKPLIVDLPGNSTFDLVTATARQMKWTIVNEQRSAGIVEATTTTPFFGFTDDIVIRLTPEGSQTRIDVRSLSRVGISDVGANADRILTFLEKIKRKPRL
jgi:uncharacterized protein (DUF1499 family)